MNKQKNKKLAARLQNLIERKSKLEKTMNMLKSEKFKSSDDLSDDFLSSSFDCSKNSTAYTDDHISSALSATSSYEKPKLCPGNCQIKHSITTNDPDDIATKSEEILFDSEILTISFNTENSLKNSDYVSSEICVPKKIKKCICCKGIYNNDMLQTIIAAIICLHCIHYINYDYLTETLSTDYIQKYYKTHNRSTCIYYPKCILCDYLNKHDIDTNNEFYGNTSGEINTDQQIYDIEI